MGEGRYPRCDKGKSCDKEGWVWAAGRVSSIWITMNGIYIKENLNLDGLVKDKVYEFAWSFNPLMLKGATGSPGNSVAIS